MIKYSQNLDKIPIGFLDMFQEIRLVILTIQLNCHATEKAFNSFCYSFCNYPFYCSLHANS